MNAFKLLRNLYLCHLSKPVAERTLYKAVRKQPIASLVEIGVGQLDRTKRLLDLALQSTPAEQFKYVGIDLFEARASTRPGITLKQAHKDLKPLGVKVQLVPGDPFGALARCANGVKTDLLVISGDVTGESLVKAWFYVPRMLTESSRVFLADNVDGKPVFRLLKRLEIEQLASTAARSLRRAA